ncbi:hypothetical protein IW261DRAFT_1546796 [Armillaria novae-zelandiae]|uniref:lytic cellulose monooxygenase (C4-dehydrogenating) n=1 Tax=Armillaria novae-zelandiae TaxID=153914 RepID=A0AA39PTH0_9AGAR|nr:hypothetical protein IW261DRAFT_1546796 [Armillaria novae-zelandiae]
MTSSCILTKIYRNYMLTASLQVTLERIPTITKDTSDHVICNGVINPYHTPFSTTIITVPAGSTGLIKYMAVDTLIVNGGKVSFLNYIEPDQYLLRHELIALHAVTSYPGTQYYGNTSLSSVSFPGAYAGSDPSITINIYQTLTAIPIPDHTILGPEEFSC